MMMAMQDIGPGGSRVTVGAAQPPWAVSRVAQRYATYCPSSERVFEELGPFTFGNLQQVAPRVCRKIAPVALCPK